MLRHFVLLHFNTIFFRSFRFCKPNEAKCVDLSQCRNFVIATAQQGISLSKHSTHKNVHLVVGIDPQSLSMSLIDYRFTVYSVHAQLIDCIPFRFFGFFVYLNEIAAALDSVSKQIFFR